MLKGKRNCGLLVTGLAMVILLAGSGAGAANKMVVIPLKMSVNSCSIINNGVCYGTITSRGKTWLDRNLGALRVATSSDDGYAYGFLFQWGRGADGHENRTSETTTTQSAADTPGHGKFIVTASGNADWHDPQNINLWQGVSGINNPCPPGFRLPTEAEWGNERTSWSSNDAAGAFASPLKLVVAGYRRYYLGGVIYSQGNAGDYWSNTVEGTNSRGLYFSSGVANMFSPVRANGFSVRCIEN